MKKIRVTLVAVLIFIFIFSDSLTYFALEIVGGSGEDLDFDMPISEESDENADVPQLEVPPLVMKDTDGKNLPYTLGMDDETEQGDIVIYEEVARNDKMVLYADMNKGLFALKNTATDYIWYSTPNDFLLDEVSMGSGRSALNSQVNISYVLRETESSSVTPYVLTSYTDAVEKNSVTVEKAENGVRVEYYFKEADIKIPVMYTITENEFVASVLVSEIDEGEQTYLIDLTLLPVFAAATSEKDGYAFVPDGSGALIDYQNHRTMDNALVLPVYCDEKAVMVEEQKYQLQSVHMPVFGMVHGNSALMGIVKEGDSACSLTVNYHNDFCRYTSIGTVMHYRTFDSVSMFNNAGNDKQEIFKASRIKYSCDTFTVGYRNLSGDKASYVGMAGEYRNYLIEEQGLTPHAKEPALHINLVGMADITASFFGIEYTKMQKLTTYQQAMQIVEDLQSKDVNRLSVRYSGWNNFGLLNSKMVKNANPSSKLGGSKNWKKLSSALEQSEIDFYPDFDLIQFRSGGNGISKKSDATHTVFGRVSNQYRYMRSVYGRVIGEKPTFLVRPGRLIDVADRILESAKSKKLSAVGLNSLGSYCYSDLIDSTGTYRSDFSKMVSDILQKYQNQNIAIGLDSANSYAAIFADCIWNMPLCSSGYDIYLSDVPFYQIVFHGYVNLTTPSVTQSDVPQLTILKAVETGSELLYTGVYENAAVLSDTRYSDLYSSTYSLWSEQAAEQNHKLMPYLQSVSKQEITAHGEVQSGVSRTEFSNGVVTFVNYTDHDVELPEGVCPANGYLILSKTGEKL